MPRWNQPKLFTLIYRSPFSRWELQNIGARVAYQSKISPLISLYLPDQRAQEKIAADRRCLILEPDVPLHLPRFSMEGIVPTPRKKISLRKQQFVPWNIKKILRDVPLNKGKGVRVGIIDTGIDLTHPDIAPNVKGGINILDSSSSPQDTNGHGTHVAGIIGALHNSFGVVGIAPRASLYAIKVLDHLGVGSLGNLISGIEWGVLNRLHILNVSITGGKIESNALNYIVNTAMRKGTLVVAAAGNSGFASGTGDTVEVPARIKGVISVAAVGKRNNRLPFSATGNKVDIAAPGEAILSTYLKKRYAILSGTSMAAAHVSGVLAIYRQLYPKLSAFQLRELVLKRALDLPPKGNDPWTGYGLVRV